MDKAQALTELTERYRYDLGRADDALATARDSEDRMARCGEVLVRYEYGDYTISVVG